MSRSSFTVLACLLALALCGCCALPAVQAPPSDHFDGEQFYNPAGFEFPGVLGALSWRMTRSRPAGWIREPDAPPGPPPPERVGPGELRVTWVGHATLLVQMSGLNVLTDPVWSERVGPVEGFGPRRVRPPGIRFEDLPPIDAVIISHNHFDHLDLPTLRRLHEAHQPVVYAGLGTARYLEAEGLPASVDLDWWQSAELPGGVTLTAAPAVHWSQRTLCDRNEALWASWVLEDGHGPVYFGGDTGQGEHFAQVRERFGPVRLAMLPIGAYEPRWFMKGQHIAPEEAVEAAHVLGAGVSVGMHYATFLLTDEARWEPLRDLERALVWRPDPPVFLTPDFGVGVDVP